MVELLITASVVLGATAVALVRRHRHRRLDMYVTNRPGIELEQTYGGWDAGAYDRGTGHDHDWSPLLGAGGWAVRGHRR